MNPFRNERPTGRNVLHCVVAAIALTACQPHTHPSSAMEPALRELRRGLGVEPETLDPQQAADNAALAVVGDLYDGLAAESADGTIVPAAAEHWTVANHGLSWIVVVKPGLRRSNGAVLTAEQFTASLDAARAPGRLRIDLARPVPYLPALLALPAAAPA